MYQLQSKDNQNEWNTVSDEYGDDIFCALEGVKSVEQRYKERLWFRKQLPDTRIVESGSKDWI